MYVDSEDAKEGISCVLKNIMIDKQEKTEHRLRAAELLAMMFGLLPVEESYD